MAPTMKKYKCRECGIITEQLTNHYGSTYSFGYVNCCPKCPPWKKYAEFGGATIWDCIDKPPIENDRSGYLESNRN